MLNDNTLYATGLELNFLPSREFEKPSSADEEPSVTARNIWRALMMGCRMPSELYSIISWKIIKAVFYSHDPIFTRAMYSEFQSGLEYVYQQLQKNKMNELQLNQAQLYIANCLTYIPYIEPENNSVLKVPQYINGSWQYVEYRVTYIELTDPSRKSFISFKDRDRVFAFGLNPVRKDSEAHPILILPGTSYPAGQGFLSHIDSDFHAFHGTGEKLYKTGRARISEWLEQCHLKPKVCGVSLGGSLSLLCAVDMGNRLARVDALNPAGLYQPFWTERKDNWETFSEKERPPVYVQKQVDDIVSQFGTWKKEFILLQSDTNKAYKGRNGFSNHPVNLAGFAETTYVKVDPHIDNQQRKMRNLIGYNILRAAFYYVALVPFRYVIVPAIRLLALMIEYAALMLEIFVNLVSNITVNTLNFTFTALMHGYSLLLGALLQMADLMFTGITKAFNAGADFFNNISDGFSLRKHSIFADSVPSEDNIDCEAGFTFTEEKADFFNKSGML